MEEQRFISVMGSATITCTPNVCVIYLYVEDKGLTIGKAITRCESKAELIERAVRRSAHTIIAIRTADFFIGAPPRNMFGEHRRTMRMASFSPGASADVLEGYAESIARVIHVKKLFITLSADAELARRIADVALETGASLCPSTTSDWGRATHSAILYSHTDFGTVRQEAVDEAISDARRTATGIAATMGVQCGVARSVSEVLSPEGLRGRQLRWDDSPPFPWSQMTESPDSLKITVAVRVHFDIVDPTESGR